MLQENDVNSTHARFIDDILMQSIMRKRSASEIILPDRVQKVEIETCRICNAFQRNGEKEEEILQDMQEPIYLLDTNPTAENIAKLIFDFTREAGFPSAMCRALLAVPDRTAARVPGRRGGWSRSRAPNV